MSWVDPVVEAYKKDVDVTLIDVRLTRTPEQRILDLMKMQEFAEEVARAGRAARTR